MTKNDPAICPTCKLPAERCLCRLGGRFGLGQPPQGPPTIELPDRNKSGKSKKEDRSRQDSSSGSGDGVVRIGRSTKGRRGKGVTIVTGLPLSGEALKETAQTLKGKCGAGGTVKDGVIEIQGDHREILQKTLESLGYRVKQSGG